MLMYEKGILPNKYNLIKGKKGYICNDIFTFDIEVTSYWIDTVGNVYNFKQAKKMFPQKKEFKKNLRPMSLVYIWQAGINDNVYYSRNLADFYTFCVELKKKVKGKIFFFVHNLSYEFQFLCNIFKWQEVFARKAHKVMKCTNELDIEFRCTLFLTRLSLEKWGDNVGVEKKVGQLDYDVIRTPLTPMNEKELEYAEFDILVMYSGLLDYRKRFGNVENIPLTQTGIVRRQAKKLFANDSDYHWKMTKLLPDSLDDYIKSVKTYRGGDTHACYLYVNHVLKNIDSYDFCSSYIYSMVTGLYPMSKWKKTTKKIHGISDKFRFRYVIEFYNIESTGFCNYISKFKCTDKKGVVSDNGKVLSAEYLKMSILDLDYDIIEKNYKWDSINIIECEQSIAGYLPKVLVELALDLYADKTTLKNVEGQEENYMNKKEMLNCLYGMMVTSLFMDDIIFDGLTWIPNQLTNEKVELILKDMHEKFYNNWLYYDWGIYVSAISRHNLWTGILTLDKEKSVVYYDTDSLKHFSEYNGTYFEDYNKEVEKTLKDVCKKRGLEYEKTIPKDCFGNIHMLGAWEKDAEYSEFITLGAKRYAYRKKNGKLGITVSGVNSEKGVNALHGDLHNFKDDMIFTEEECGKKILTYLNDMQSVIMPDGYITTDKFGINMMPTTYNMSLADDFETLLSMIAEKANCAIINRKLVD